VLHPEPQKNFRMGHPPTSSSRGKRGMNGAHVLSALVSSFRFAQCQEDEVERGQRAASVRISVFLLILAVRSILSQLKGLPSMARLSVLKRTIENNWR